MLKSNEFTAKNIMVQGTASSVGKSIIAAALCRIFLQDGYRVAPFKSQNMALNSFVTKEGLEMGRAQAVQAESCKIEPSVLMNPILLKPTTDKKTQVIINGKVRSNMDSREYYKSKPEARSIIMDAYRSLCRQYDIIVIEGAGSPAEINLRGNDIVNMGMAEMADAPVLLVADIDKGGVFASIVGTVFLLTEHERLRVKGIIINKFRGDIELLNPGIKMLEEMINIPVIGVIPYMKLNLEDEDSVTERFAQRQFDGEIKIDVVKLPHISNFSDFNVFNMFNDADLNYIESPEEIDDPDILILPGSKNTIEDMSYVKETGIEGKILELYRKGRIIIGICAGYQMLGKAIEDPSGVESGIGKIDGLGILDMKTVMTDGKITKQVTGEIASGAGVLEGLKGKRIKGYEIHMGISSGNAGDSLAVTGDGFDGIVSNNVIGTYIHGIFDSIDFTRGLINNIRRTKGLPPLMNNKTYHENKEEEFNKLADIVRKNVDMKKIYNILYR